jgi:hypothetical protein
VTGIDIIAVAIDDNQIAWTEMLVPFLLSLRKTSFSGEVIVLSYGLTEEKQDILQRLGVGVTPCGSSVPLSTDRFLAAASIVSARPDGSRLALYDADIWFPHEDLDIFNNITGETKIYAAPDAWLCGFVTDPLIGPEKDRLHHLCTNGMIEQLGQPVQAGLVAATKAAWVEFAKFLQEQVARIGVDFTTRYGLDTTLISLYAGLGFVELLDPSYNAVTKWGIGQIGDLIRGVVHLQLGQRPVQGLHATTDVRFNSTWRYFNRDFHFAYENGRALMPQSWARPTHDQEFGNRELRKLALIGLKIEIAQSDCTIALLSNEYGNIIDDSACESVIFIARGTSTLKLSAQSDVRLLCTTTFFEGKPSPLFYRMSAGNGAIEDVRYREVTIRAAGGDAFCLQTFALPGQQCAAMWHIRRL